jgi:hypothetical protein
LDMTASYLTVMHGMIVTLRSDRETRDMSVS